MEVIDPKSEIMTETFDNFISPNLLEIANYDDFIEIIELAQSTVPISNM